MTTITFTFPKDSSPGAGRASVTVERTAALELNLIAVARQLDELLTWDSHCDSFEVDMRAALDGSSARRIDSLLDEMRSWAEDEDRVLVFDRDTWCFALTEGVSA